MSRDPATNYTDDDIDLTSYNQDNFQHSCFDVDPNDSGPRLPMMLESNIIYYFSHFNIDIFLC